MLNLKKPALIFGLIAIIIFFIGLYYAQTRPENGDQGGMEWLLYIGAGLAAIYWIWSIIDVASATDLKPYQKKFWLILVIAVPAFGGTLFPYYAPAAK